MLYVCSTLRNTKNLIRINLSYV